MNSNSGNSSDNTNNMSLIGHNGGLSIGKAERPGPSLGKKAEKPTTPSGSRSQSLERRGLGQMLNGILHGHRRDEAHLRADDSSETASLSSVATEKRGLLGGKGKASSPSKSSSSARREPRMPNINESVVPRGGLR
ncbi:hypothetical protein TGAMA5MH_00180 [Trichoderma gamsii]|uniref:Uncharacterized protein n=1 Tax=Trichoderma gamsii TaxID=398673 RepID=A0A2K0TTA2_9HYPO|nr:hypothetical protein TGAMA5MH_00180 [Trichoderma gamsii]